MHQPVVLRDRLVGALLRSNARLVKIIAPAGFGKSTVARELVAAARRSAVVDLSRAGDAAGLVRELINAVLVNCEPVLRAAYVEQTVAYGSDLAGWFGLAAEVAPMLDDGMLLVENAEALAGNRALLEVLERVLAVLPDTVTLVVCARADPGLQLDRFSTADRTHIVTADMLRFDREQIAHVFAELGCSASEIDAVQRFTRGWPMVVMMLFMLGRRGRLDAYLHDRPSDAADLYAYLASEVVTLLEPAQREVLAALAAIPDASENDLIALFPDPAYRDVLARLERETPFVTVHPSRRIDLHPAMRQMLAAASPPDVWLARLFDVVDRGDGGLRAAEIAMLRGREYDAATSLIDLARPYPFVLASERFDTIVSGFSRATLIAFPALWSATAYTRISYDTVAAISDGERIAAAFTPETPLPVVLGTLSILAQLYLNRGLFRDAQRIAGRLRSDPLLTGIPFAGLIADFADFTMHAYRGDLIDLDVVDERFAAILAEPSTRACMEAIVIAAFHRLHGDRVAEDAALARSNDVARSAGVPLVAAMCFVHSAFGAWFWGDDARFETFLSASECAMAPGTVEVMQHFSRACRGQLTGNEPSNESVNLRSYALLIACARSADRDEERRFADDALAAAIRSSQRFGIILAHVARARIDPDLRAADLARALELARETESQAMISAVRALQAGRSDCGMLSAFAARYEEPAANSAGVVEIRGRTVSAGGATIDLSKRDRDVLVYLARQSGAVSAEAIAAAIWPHLDAGRARGTLRVNISRLRKRLADPAIIIAVGGGYRLGCRVTITP